MTDAELDPSLNKVPPKVHHIHIMGICGTGMAALAGMLQSRGYLITGSDSHVYPPMSDFLVQLGISVRSGYKADNLAPRPDLVIVGNVITRKNPEAIALGQARIPYLSFPQTLAQFFISEKRSIVISGTHGKTTSCSLLASAMHQLELDPTFMIGGILPEFSGNFRLGEGDYFIAEGDEYDTAFFDKESKFLHYQPHIAVLTSIEFDHADIFNDLDQIKRSFAKFVALIPKDGLLIANFDDHNVREICAKARCQVQSYGMSPGYNWSFSPPSRVHGMTSMMVNRDGEEFGEIAISLAGNHNCLNALAVTAILSHIGLSAEQIALGMEKFAGVKRRQEVRGVEKGITVIDDFAHHPTAVRETIAALRMAYPDQRLVVVFEPRTNTSRRAIFQQEYVRSFDQSDLLCIREPIPLTNVEPGDHFSSPQLARDLQERGLNAHSFNTTDDILEYLKKTLATGDVVAILSNGGFDNIHTRLLEDIKSGRQ